MHVNREVGCFFPYFPVMGNAIILFSAFIIFSACNESVNIPDKEIQKLHWLLGEWDKQVKVGQTGYEKWSMGTNGELDGMDITLAGPDTISFEKIKITDKNGTLYYVVNAPGDTAVAFKITSIKSDEFICENKAHDFPKKIHYVRNGNQLKATISGQGEAMDFNFVKKSSKE